MPRSTGIAGETRRPGAQATTGQATTGQATTGQTPDGMATTGVETNRKVAVALSLVMLGTLALLAGRQRTGFGMARYRWR